MGRYNHTRLNALTDYVRYQLHQESTFYGHKEKEESHNNGILLNFYNS